jgi:hypothetical protein
METFKKRQKEMQRLERQRDKFAKRMERKLHRGDAPPEETPDGTPEENPEGTPVAIPESESNDKPAAGPDHAD